VPGKRRLFDTRIEGPPEELKGTRRPAVRSLTPNSQQEANAMAPMARKCAQCGATDSRTTWASADEAAKQGAFDGKWSCSSCAWTDFDLVEADTDAAKQPDPVSAR
jgi:hypothetical protein